ncbi:hypothetical protein HYPSUDRAFT_211173 [Hypholoma sublateritium FD-334 SS-4]|uniref:Uncharacterized protein n=1 Tax=Hypholoma sublateritium (strain FD-334 SS-4) TaxID=945553 RepID=A0A0D2LMM7_HYPSF|nr:hypothetical protein HYPSUDRAFT_211173 [Hypholoma sublateritium FD-334 SS-4]
MSEIDDIFSGKAKGKAPAPTGKAVSSTNPSPNKDKKKQKKKKKKTAPAPHADVPTDVAPIASSSKKRPAPETVVDTSRHLLAPAKRRKVDPVRDDSKVSSTRPKKGIVDPDTLFKDSRGTSDRRKTEEGWSVYKEDELGIGDEGGGEQLCVPSFSYSTAAFNQTHHYVLLIVTVVFKILEQYISFCRRPTVLFHDLAYTALSKPL